MYGPVNQVQVLTDEDLGLISYSFQYNPIVRISPAAFLSEEVKVYKV